MFTSYIVNIIFIINNKNILLLVCNSFYLSVGKLQKITDKE